VRRGAGSFLRCATTPFPTSASPTRYVHTPSAPTVYNWVPFAPLFRPNDATVLSAEPPTCAFYALCGAEPRRAAMLPVYARSTRQLRPIKCSCVKNCVAPRGVFRPQRPPVCPLRAAPPSPPLCPARHLGAPRCSLCERALRLLYMRWAIEGVYASACTMAGPSVAWLARSGPPRVPAARETPPPLPSEAPRRASLLLVCARPAPAVHVAGYRMPLCVSLHNGRAWRGVVGSQRPPACVGSA